MLQQLLLLQLFTSFFIFGWQYVTLYDYDPKKDVKFAPSASNPNYPGDEYHISATNKEILWFLRFYFMAWTALEAPKFRWLLKPLFLCRVCMAGPYGTAMFIFWFFYTHQAFTLLTIPTLCVFLVATAGANRLLGNLSNLQ